MKRERWANSLIIGIIFFVFSLPAGLISAAIFTDPYTLLVAPILAVLGPIFGFVMIIVGIIQLISKKGQK